VYKLAKKISSHFNIGGVYMLHRGTCVLSSNHDYTQVIKVFVVHMHSGIVLVSKLFSGLHVARVKETPSLGFSVNGLLLSEF
jgi:hypothetical protein